MRINWGVCCTLVFMSAPALAEHEHGAQVFYAFTLEADAGASHDGMLVTWDLDGWIGTDKDKIWIRSEGQKTESETAKQAEFWALYSRTISDFWDAQVGVRYDMVPKGTGYWVAGLRGIAPFFIETEAHIFASDQGELTARLHAEKDLYLTQKWIAQPYIEINASAQHAEEQKIGRGMTHAEFGVMTRYTLTRSLAPYVDLHYEAAIGETAHIAASHGENRDEGVASVGVRVVF